MFRFLSSGILMMPNAKLIALIVLLSILCSSCSKEDQPAPSPANDGPLAAIHNPNSTMDEVEELSESVANRLIEFSYRLKERDMHGARRYLSDKFLGTEWKNLEGEDSQNLPMGVRQVTGSVSSTSPMVGPEDFLGTLDDTLANFGALDRVFFKTRGAEFDAKGSRAVLKMTASIIGREANGAQKSLYVWARAAAQNSAAGWQMSAFKIERFRRKSATAELFTNVAGSSGVAVEGSRVGSVGNDKFYWRGASVFDIDGDGLDDIFSSGLKKNFLYRNQGDGTFQDIAKQANLASPVGPTSAIFFDYDRDGDQDVFFAFVGWEKDGLPLGGSLRLMRNDEGVFHDVSKETGISQFRGPSFSAVAGDFDLDGWLDLYVCNYERLDAAYPNSWFGATNGAENFLLMNQGGEKFRNEALARGIADRGWTFAAAAADFDDDGDLDLYSVNDYGTNALYVNDGQGNFRDLAEQYGVKDCGNGMGASWGDFNNDGRLDLYVSNMSSSAGKRILNRLVPKDVANGVQKTLYKLAAGNSVFLNLGKSFQRTSPAMGGQGASWAWCPLIFDANLDGHADVYVANGFISGDSLKDT